MITSITLIVLAFIWLMYETNFLRVRLTGNYGYETPELDNAIYKLYGYPSYKPEPQPENVKPYMATELETDVLEPVKKELEYTPTEFIPLDMPEADGIINVNSFRITESEYEKVA